MVLTTENTEFTEIYKERFFNLRVISAENSAKKEFFRKLGVFCALCGK